LHFFAEVEKLFPTVLSALYRVDPQTYEFLLERCLPLGLDADLEKEVQAQIADGAFALAVRRQRPTPCRSQVLHRYHPRVHSILLVPLVTFHEVHGVTIIASERQEQDFLPHELKLLSLLARQTALAHESAHRQAVLEQQQTQIEQEVQRRTAELESSKAQALQVNQELEIELKKARKATAQPPLSTSSRENLLASASHELRTPLGAIMGSLDILREDWGDRLPPEGQQLLDICIRNSSSLLSLLSTLVEVSRFESERGLLSRKRIRLSPLVQKIFESLTALAKTHNVKLLSTVNAKIEVYADEQRLQQILTNLVSHAIESAHKEGGYVLVGATAEEGRVIIGVSDNGVGIPPAQQEQIFKPFTQGGGSSSASTKGDSLGLILCKTLVEQHGGKIWLESSPGKGSRFFFFLPN
jgi:signal transduction histidine kinase